LFADVHSLIENWKGRLWFVGSFDFEVFELFLHFFDSFNKLIFFPHVGEGESEREMEPE
jgi:hypothetical protein